MKEKKWIPAPSTMLGTGFAGMTNQEKGFEAQEAK
jgi:hypothetical protein